MKFMFKKSRQKIIGVNLFASSFMIPIMTGGMTVTGLTVSNTAQAAASCSCVTRANNRVRDAVRDNTRAVDRARIEIIEAIGVLGNKNNASIGDHLSGTVDAFEHQTQEIQEMLDRYAQFKVEKQLEDRYGGSPPSIVCSDTNLGGGVNAGGGGGGNAPEARRAVLEAINDWHNNEADATLADKVVRGADLEDEDIGLIGDMMIGGHVSPDDIARQQEIIERMIEWNPLPYPTEAELDNANSWVLRSSLRERKLRLEPSSVILSQVAASSRPAYPLGDWGRDVFQQTGEEGIEAFEEMISESGGDISHNQMLDLMVKSRSITNPDYVVKLYTELEMTENDLQREMVMQMAINNTLLLEQIRTQQSLAMLEASKEAREVDYQTRQRINTLRRQTATTRPTGDN